MYVLCFKYLTQDYERFLVKNKKKTTFVVSIALTDLGFNVRAVYEYICRRCQKLDHLQQNLEDLQIPRGRGGGGGNFAHDGGATEDVATQISRAEQ